MTGIAQRVDNPEFEIFKEGQLSGGMSLTSGV